MADRTISQKRPPRNDLTAEYVRSILSYNPETGEFAWKDRHDVSARCSAIYAGKVAGSSKGRRYYSIAINAKKYYAHRLAWLMVTGEWPVDGIDHKNNNKTDNRFENLRQADTAQNAHNQTKSTTNTSGYKGVSWDKKNKKWFAHIAARGKQFNLGRHDTPQEAHAAYCAAAERLHGAFANGGST